MLIQIQHQLHHHEFACTLLASGRSNNLYFQSINWWLDLVRFVLFALVNSRNTLCKLASITTSLLEDQAGGIVVASGAHM